MFKIDIHYDFDPPVETNCILADRSGGWEQREFSGGVALKHLEGNTFVFLGKPINDEREYFFHIEYGGGSAATENGFSL